MPINDLFRECFALLTILKLDVETSNNQGFLDSVLQKFTTWVILHIFRHTPILELLEREGIDSLYIELETDPERNKREQKAANN